MRVRRLLIVAAIVGLALVGLAGRSDAHTSVKTTEPGVGATVAPGVESIVVTFFHPILPTPTLAISGPGAPTVTGAPLLLSGDAAVRQSVGGVVEDGEYRVDIDFVSSDGDRQEFSYTFSVAAPARTSDSGPFLPIDLDVLRLVLHVLAATVWVGGQLVLAGLVGTLRSLGEDAPRLAARRFNRIAWPAFGILVATGLWNLAEADLADRSGAYRATVVLKLALVGLSGAGAAVHAAGGTRTRLAVGGAASALGAILALAVGVLLAHG